MAAIEGFGAPQYYRAEPRTSLLRGFNLYAVNMNGHTDVATYGTRCEAELDAARRNYVECCGHSPEQLGLDGI